MQGIGDQGHAVGKEPSCDLDQGYEEIERKRSQKPFFRAGLAGKRRYMVPVAILPMRPPLVLTYAHDPPVVFFMFVFHMSSCWVNRA
jgi:hypothetical protein